MKNELLSTFNAFIEDTCVVGTVAYGLTRTRALGAFFAGSTPEGRTLLGLVFGLLASSEVIFAGDRAPYVFHTLLICLADFAGGIEVSIPAILTVFAASLTLHGGNEGLQTLLTLGFVGAISELVRRTWTKTPGIWIGALIAGFAQLVALSLRNHVLPNLGFGPLPPYVWTSVIANTFGMGVVILVWRDSQTRLESEKNRISAEHLQTLLVSADLAALRARIRPHFLFNTLTAIAALCDIDPKKAQSAVLKVSQLMRRNIEVDTSSPITLRQELEYVRTYVEIQRVRFGKRAAVFFDIPEGLDDVELPAFSLQTLVENSFIHGVEKRSGRGSIRIAVRARKQDILYAVIDDGLGMEAAQVRSCLLDENPPRHGLAIVDSELRASMGNKGGLRLLSKPGLGTTAFFRIKVIPLSS